MFISSWYYALVAFAIAIFFYKYIEYRGWVICCVFIYLFISQSVYAFIFFLVCLLGKCFYNLKNYSNVGLVKKSSNLTKDVYQEVCKVFVLTFYMLISCQVFAGKVFLGLLPSVISFAKVAVDKFISHSFLHKRHL